MNERKNTGKRKAIISALAVVAVFGVFAFASNAFAVTSEQVGLTPGLASSFGLATGDIRTIIGNIIRIFLGLLGLVAVSLMIYAGFLYMTAAGNAEQVAKAKSVMIQATIGLIIIVTSFAIVTFVVNALNQATGGSAADRARVAAEGGFSAAARGSSALGNGILSYHYPEPGATEIPRNTKIAITFKKAIKLSTVFKDYDDNGTFTTTDDKVGGQPVCTTVDGVETCQTVKLNIDNIKLIANSGLGSGPSAGATEGKTDADLRFEARYPDSAVVTDVNVRTTEVGDTYNPAEEQTIVLKPVAPIGSATEEVNYRVALRGGANGIMAWLPKTVSSPSTCTATPCLMPAFPELFVDGSYYWAFTTSTTLDTSPPHVTDVVPLISRNPESRLIDRNQVIQIYFDEPVDPTTVTGNSGAGFTKVTIKSRPLGTPSADLVSADLVSVAGSFTAGNGYRTVEFVPSTLCDEGVSTNSCGEPVYCLPRDSRLEVVVKAASVGAQPPQASASNGVTDMVDNSLDGNKDGTAQGPVADARTQMFFINNPQSDLATVSDTVQVVYAVGSNIDLIPPKILDMSPRAGDSTSNAAWPAPSVAYNAGPSSVPAGVPITVSWDKTLMVRSLRTGVYPPTSPAPATIMLQARENRKNSAGGNPIPVLDPPSFFPTSRVQVVNDVQRTELQINHRVFFTADDLGYNDDDVAANPLVAPRYTPIIGSQVRDTKQNCYYPSAVDIGCSGVDETSSFCCNRTSGDQASFQNLCGITGSSP